LNQSDKNGQGQVNGLYHLLQKMESYTGKEELERMVKVIQFDEKDVERSKLVGLMVNVYGPNNQNTNANINKKIPLSRNNDDAALIPLHHMKCKGDDCIL